MMKKLTFKRGDLVREKHFTTQERGYGIILGYVGAGTSNHYKCLWDNEVIVWLKPEEMYLVARGQNGYTS
jgi:hypothetical protein